MHYDAALSFMSKEEGGVGVGSTKQNKENYPKEDNKQGCL